MADSFFGFNTEIPSGLNVLGRKGVEEELLTDEVEEEYDALNDETFGRAANDDWEDAHEKLTELVKKNDYKSTSVFDDSLLDGDESQNEIISKSISQLGLEDDLDDPAIMTISRSKSIMTRYGRSSPPPPAFLETEHCGSPKTHSIWSTTPKDSAIASLLQSISHGSSYGSQKTPLLSTSSDNVFPSPLQAAWRAEELERDLLSSADKDVTKSSRSSSWPQPPFLVAPSSQEKAGIPIRLLDSAPTKERMLTQEEVERHLHSDPRPYFPPPPNQNNFQKPNAPMQFPHGPVRPNIPKPVPPPNHNMGAPIHSPVMPLRPPGMMRPLIANMIPNQVPLRNFAFPNLPTGFKCGNVNLPPNNMQNMLGPPFMYRTPQPINFPNLRFNGEFSNQYSGDDYDGLMTQHEKEWLIKIQLLLLKTENPYIEDYYYSTLVTRNCRKKFSENSRNGSGDGPELLLPEISKTETKTYVPMQFAGSLGKLQAVSVNFPRKVLDITVARPHDEEEKQTNQSLIKYRRVLMEIEKLYDLLLQIDDEERRILALPDSGAESHRQIIVKLTEKIFSNLCDSSALEDNFQSIVSIRKGRNLMVRAFKVFNKDQKFYCLKSLLRYLSFVLRKDQSDLVLLRNHEVIISAVEKFVLSELIELGEALHSSSSPDSTSGRERNNVLSALKSKVGSSIICSIIFQAENKFSGFNSLEASLQNRWEKFVIHVADTLCNLNCASICAPVVSCGNLSSHFQRFPLNDDTLDSLKEKLDILDTDPKGGGDSATR